MRLLVVDDDVSFTEDLSAVAPADIEIEVVHSSVDALESLRRRLPDAVVLDLHMPARLVIDPFREGLAVLGVIFGGYGDETKVVVVTESASPQVEEICHRLGAVAVLTKAEGLLQVFMAVYEACAEAANRA